MPFQVFKEPCNNCLLSKDRIVSPQSAKEIIQGCIQDHSFFVCHKSSMSDEDQICCKSFYDKLGQHSKQIRIAERFNMVELVEQKETQKLPTYSQMNNEQKPT